MLSEVKVASCLDRKEPARYQNKIKKPRFSADTGGSLYRTHEYHLLLLREKVDK